VIWATPKKSPNLMTVGMVTRQNSALVNAL
jgi:hypothetical protein